MPSSVMLTRVSPKIQNYDWGKIGMESAVAKLIVSSDGGEVDEKTPYAESWMGTHPSGPSTVQLNGNTVLLSEYIRGELPFLFKVLSVNKALSIQAHPNKELGAILHARRPDLYKDPNHKPELACAITPFESMCGFRPVSEIAHHLSIAPELRAIVGDELSHEFESAVSAQKSKSEIKPILKQVFTKVMTVSKEVLQSQVDALVARVKKEGKGENSGSGSSIDVNELILRLSGEYPGDVGLFAPYLLNCFRLSPGESIYLPANEPHAYLLGDCVECMACSDNVVRAGLTPKHRDTDVLCEMLTYEPRFPDVLHGDVIDSYTRTYPTPAPEFSLSRTELPNGTIDTYSLPSVKGHSLILCYEGSGTVSSANGGESYPLRPGMVYLIPDSQILQITHDNTKDKLLLFRCAENHVKSQ